VIELPAVREEELRAVVAGEMEHYRMIPAGQSTFGFLRLGETDEDQRRTRLLLMASDRNVVDKYRETLRLAGLQMLALEPSLVASSRAAYPSVNEGGVALIAVGARTTELAIFCNGALCYSRQIDTGTLDILGGGAASTPAPQQISELVQDAPEHEPEHEAQLTPVGSTQTDLGSLAYELGRSLDFYHREMPRAARVERLVLSGDVEQLPGLESHLADSLKLPVSVCQPFEQMDYRASAFSPDHLTRIGPSFACAVGLALQAMGEARDVSYLDLSDTGRESRLAKAAPKWLTGSLGISIVLVIAALATSLAVGQVLGARKQALAKAKAELERVAQVERERTQAARRAREAITLVELRGLPWSDILFQLSEFIPEGVWMTGLQAEGGNTLSLDGMALSADAVADFMEFLTRAPLFADPAMTRIQQAAEGTRSVVRYQIKVTVIEPASAPLRAAEDTAGPGATR
jgi:type IV pilus assembly protein PilM